MIALRPMKCLITESLSTYFFGECMTSKILLMIVLFSSFLILDLVYFFPVLVIFLVILKSLEKDIMIKEREQNIRL